MAVPRSLSFLRIGTGAQGLEVYLDPLCPFSAKMTKSLTTNVLPLLSKGGKYDGQLSLIARIYPQPFHYLGSIHTEALLVFGAAYPGLFWTYLSAVRLAPPLCHVHVRGIADVRSAQIMETQETYYNQKAAKLTIDEVRDQLVHLAIKTLEEEHAISGPTSKVYGDLRAKLEVTTSPNGGNEATAGLKHTVKIGRQNGIHVTPTVLFDGLKEDSVSSSWGKDEWEKFLKEKLES
ncbi:hypothetical protein P7C73_g4254, partial [Tremellales sp. Uapishka_1]